MPTMCAATRVCTVPAGQLIEIVAIGRSSFPG